jgi:hypothetical protein
MESVQTLDLSVQTLGRSDISVGQPDIQVVSFFVSFTTTPILSQSNT